LTSLRPRWPALLGVLAIVGGVGLILVWRLFAALLTEPRDLAARDWLLKSIIASVGLVMIGWSISFLTEARGVSFDDDLVEQRTLQGIKRIRWAAVSRVSVRLNTLELRSAKERLDINLGILKEPDALIAAAKARVPSSSWSGPT
jgi:hypothetical protein